MDDEIEASPSPAVKNLRSKFESLAVSNDASPPPRPVSWNGSSAGTPKPRVASTSLAPVATSNTQIQTPSSELKGLKRPPPPPPTRGSRPTTPSPMPSPLLRAVPAPPNSPESQRHAPRMPSISLIDTDVHEDDSGVKGVAALRSRFLDVSPSRESLSLTDSSRPPSRLSTDLDSDESPASVLALRSKFLRNTAPPSPASYSPSRASGPHFVAPPKPPHSTSHSQSSSSASSTNSSHDPFFENNCEQGSSDTVPSLPPRPPQRSNEDVLIDFGTAHSDTSSPNSSETDSTQPSSLPKVGRHPPPRPPPRHRPSAADASPPTTLTAAAPPLPNRRATAPLPLAMQEPGRPALPIRPTIPVPSNVSPTEYVASPVSDRRVLGASKALPPPMRKIGLNDKLPEIRKPVGHDDSDSDSESEDEEMVKGVETLPDSTNTSRRMPHMHNIHEGYRTNVPVKMDLYHGHCRMSGTHVVVAENHKIRIYDISFQDAPIYVLDPKSAGLKAGEMRCVEFRAGGRYFWVGTSNGCVFEGDTHTGEFTGAKASAHLQAVSHIFRHADSMITLDESGKALVWTPHSHGEAIRLSNHIPRVVRISEKIDYAKCVNGMLWTAHRKDRMNVGTPQSVPVIRVYDILAPGCVVRNVFTTSHAGPITCATILPSDPSHAYAGHEEGFISIWDIDTPDRYPVCVEVMKVSTTDVLCMEGVYNRLWTGARSGLVTVYDISQRPWQVTNSWAPHNGMPVAKLQVDPFGVARTRRLCVLTHARDEVLHFWDGMLSVDWMEDQLLKHEQSFSTFRDLNVLIMTWNCDAAKPEHLSGDPANLELLQDVLTSVDSPDVLVFGFQEMIDLESRKLAAKNIVTSLNKKHEDIGPGPEKLSGPYKKWYDRLALTIRLAMPPDCPYVCVTADSLIGLFQCVFVKVSERVSLKSLDVNSVKRGIGGRYGNKGAILSRLVIDDTSLCFINCHLAAGQSHVRSRNADVTSILEAATVFPPDQSSKPVAYVGGGDGAAVADHEIIYLNGDLNYRIDQRRDAIINAVKLNDLDSMLHHDQLLKEIKYNRGCRLRTFTEGHIRFGPTYKFDRRTDTYDTSEKRRAPAWCDRVMWRSAVPARVEQLHYQRYEANVSDHRPVSAAFRMTVKSVRHEVRDKYRQEVEMRWAKEEQRLLDVLVSYYQSRELV